MRAHPGFGSKPKPNASHSRPNINSARSTVFVRCQKLNLCTPPTAPLRSTLFTTNTASLLQPCIPHTLAPVVHTIDTTTFRQVRSVRTPATAALGETHSDDQQPPSAGQQAIQDILQGLFAKLGSWKPPKYVWRSLAALVLGGEVMVRILQGIFLLA